MILFLFSNKNEINGGGINKACTSESSEIIEAISSVPLQRWWSELIQPECELDIGMSGKLLILEKIINYCSLIGDKL